MKLLIAIPALNEEESIASIIERSLAARENIVKSTAVTAVEITVVSDGSTDHTVEIAKRYADRIKLIVFEKNRGYGAAIKEAWRQSDAELLGFLDADGTCDPNFFVQLCQSAEKESADVVLGCRLNAGSKMPLVRRVGNVGFALTLSLLASRWVRDTASGMRVVRRTCLPALFPLPDGLHFTPAMSARALLSEDVKIVEVDMPYAEREGDSKLRVIRDGLRFLRVILEAALLYRPSRPLGMLGLACAVAAIALIASPTVYYLHHRSVQEWMIYRFVVVGLATSTGCLLFSGAHLARVIVTMLASGRSGVARPSGILGRFFGSRFFWAVPAALFLVGGWLVLPSFLDLVRTGATYEHWSRFIVMSTMFSCALILLVSKLIEYSLLLMAAQLSDMAASARWGDAPPPSAGAPS